MKRREFTTGALTAAVFGQAAQAAQAAPNGGSVAHAAATRYAGLVYPRIANNMGPDSLIKEHLDRIRTAVEAFESFSITPATVEATILKSGMAADKIDLYRQRVKEYTRPEVSPRVAALSAYSDAVSAGVRGWDKDPHRDLDALEIALRNSMLRDSAGPLSPKQAEAMAARLGGRASDYAASASILDYLTTADFPSAVHIPQYGVLRPEIMKEINASRAAPAAPKPAAPPLPGLY